MTADPLARSRAFRYVGKLALDRVDEQPHPLGRDPELARRQRGAAFEAALDAYVEIGLFDAADVDEWRALAAEPDARPSRAWSAEAPRTCARTAR